MSGGAAGKRTAAYELEDGSCHGREKREEGERLQSRKVATSTRPLTLLRTESNPVSIFYGFHAASYCVYDTMGWV
jgi:hypothetical protein